MVSGSRSATANSKNSCLPRTACTVHILDGWDSAPLCNLSLSALDGIVRTLSTSPYLRRVFFFGFYTGTIALFWKVSIINMSAGGRTAGRGGCVGVPPSDAPALRICSFHLVLFKDFAKSFFFCSGLTRKIHQSTCTCALCCFKTYCV